MKKMTSTQRSARWRSRNPGTTVRLPEGTVNMLNALRKYFDKEYSERRSRVDLISEAVKLFHDKIFKTE
jgi:hypothetical protein